MNENITNFSAESGERDNRSSLFVPAGLELFLAGTGGKSGLPPDIAAHPDILESSAFRRKIHTTYSELFLAVRDPGTDMATALQSRDVDPAQAEAFYRQTAEFLARDPLNGRLVLYLPLELLPDFHSSSVIPDPVGPCLPAGGNPVSDRSEKRRGCWIPDQVGDDKNRLNESQRIFRDAYRDAWIRLLYESDVRALFVDGDVLEEGLGKPRRVRKAAHLFPFLFRKGIVTAGDAAGIAGDTDDAELLDSLRDGLMAALRTGDNRAEILPVIKQINRQLGGRRAAGEYPALTRPNAVWIGTLRSLPEDTSAAEIISRTGSHWDETEEILNGSENGCAVSAKRMIWKKSISRDAILSAGAGEIAGRMLAGAVTMDSLMPYLSGDPPETVRIIALKSLVYAGDAYARLDMKLAGLFAESVLGALPDYEIQPPNVADAMMELLSHWKNSGIIGDEMVRRMGIHVPYLASVEPGYHSSWLSDRLNYLVRAAEQVAGDADLRDAVFPFFLAYGSVVKGYGSVRYPDSDAAVFIRPGVPWDRRAEILHLIRTRVPELQRVEKVREFWIGETNGSYTFRIPPVHLPDVGGAQSIHMLFDGAWVGRNREMTDIRATVIRKYLNLDRFGAQKDDVRFELIRRLEMDMLQMRLMHKGYRRFYPAVDGGTVNLDMIDGYSDFWDPGYRRLASLLFLSRVYLPELSL